MAALRSKPLPSTTVAIPLRFIAASECSLSPCGRVMLPIHWDWTCPYDCPKIQSTYLTQHRILVRSRSAPVSSRASPAHNKPLNGTAYRRPLAGNVGRNENYDQ
jgi:hypothetical protein